jgi:hypothetical protein
MNYHHPLPRLGHEAVYRRSMYFCLSLAQFTRHMDYLVGCNAISKQPIQVYLLTVISFHDFISSLKRRRHNIMPDVERMAWRSILVELECMRHDAVVPQHFEHMATTTAKFTGNAPRANDQSGVGSGSQDCLVIFWPNNIFASRNETREQLGIGFTPSEHIHYDHTAVLAWPKSDPDLATSHRWIVVDLIGSAWIHHHEADFRLGRIPLPPEAVAIAATRREYRASVLAKQIRCHCDFAQVVSLIIN